MQNLPVCYHAGSDVMVVDVVQILVAFGEEFLFNVGHPVCNVGFNVLVGTHLVGVRLLRLGRVNKVGNHPLHGVTQSNNDLHAKINIKFVNFLKDSKQIGRKTDSHVETNKKLPVARYRFVAKVYPRGGTFFKYHMFLISY